jgi:caa(3)-type oxidase subunit IV
MNVKRKPDLARTYVALLVLLSGTVGVAFLHLGVLNIIVCLLIATLQMVLVTLSFMELRFGGQINWVVAAASLLWLGVLFVLVMGDYATRTWVGR